MPRTEWYAMEADSGGEAEWRYWEPWAVTSDIDHWPAHVTARELAAGRLIFEEVRTQEGRLIHVSLVPNRG